MINEDHRPVLIVIAGPNGSDKTTITSRILHHEWMELLFRMSEGEVIKQYTSEILE